jgi:integrase
MRADLTRRYTRLVTRNTMLRALAIARYGYECGLVGRDPTVGVDPGPKYRAGDATERVTAEQVPTRAEALAILAGAPSGYRAAAALGLTGLRIGETLGMTADRVAVERREVTVDQQAQPLTGRGMVLTTPKAERGAHHPRSWPRRRRAAPAPARPPRRDAVPGHVERAAAA